MFDDAGSMPDGQPPAAAAARGAPSAMRRPRSAFSLIEITLALLVFAVGILAILALFPAGVKLSNDAYMETRMAALAELILNSVAVQVDMDRGFDDNRWTQRTLDFSAPQAGAWDGEADGRLAIVANATNLPGSVATNVYRLLPGKAAGQEDFVFRYRLTVKRPDKGAVELYDAKYREFTTPRRWRLKPRPFDDPGLNPTNEWDMAIMDSPTREWVTAGDYLVKATLAVWPGRYGGQARYFYRYYYLFHP